MKTYSKAIGAAIGGGLAGTGVSIAALPEGSPWYAYVLMALVTTAVPALITYFAPQNAK
ncbi:hypothetical protein [Rhizobium sp. G21]|uniref:hypothetical protein n=1 Tax=Rhizobium sp. G21 TaxID=2758439 RepID=UPI001600C747|nr:hypothetical protein [Rhizobium sp. G21]MBB1247474.1 hypothetical protein [Rhizobium sp. G21]